MTQCQICKKEFSSRKSFSGHLASHKITIEEYCLKYIFDNKRPKCPICDKDTNFVRGKNVYREYCSEHANESRKKWSKENGFGGKQDAGWKKGLTKKDHPGIAKQSKKMKGENNPFFGKRHSFETYDLISQKRSEKLKYSQDKFESIRKNHENFEIISDYEKYKNQNTLLKVKCKKCGHVQNKSLFSLKKWAACEKCYIRQETSPETKDKISNSLKLTYSKYEEKKEQIKDFEFVTKYKDYKNVDQKLEVVCRICGKKQNKSLFDMCWNNAVCEECKINTYELKIKNYLESLGLSPVLRKRDIIPPYELDFFIPEKKLAIEHNGLHWHSEQFKEKKYHLKKTEMCQEKGVHLIHIFSDEIENKYDVIKSIIACKAGISPNRIYARKCEFGEISNKEGIEFFERTHISGGVRAKKTFGLFYENKLVCCLSVRAPFHRKYKGSVEIARFASELDFSIVGGFSKLFKRVKKWAIENEYNSIITYADLKFGDGKVYNINGFEFLGKTPLTFWYTDGKVRYNRFKFRAKDGKPEKQVAKENGVHRIYGPGNYLFEYKLDIGSKNT